MKDIYIKLLDEPTLNGSNLRNYVNVFKIWQISNFDVFVTILNEPVT